MQWYDLMSFTFTKPLVTLQLSTKVRLQCAVRMPLSPSLDALLLLDPSVALVVNQPDNERVSTPRKLFVIETQ